MFLVKDTKYATDGKVWLIIWQQLTSFLSVTANLCDQQQQHSHDSYCNVCNITRTCECVEYFSHHVGYLKSSICWISTVKIRQTQYSHSPTLRAVTSMLSCCWLTEHHTQFKISCSSQPAPPLPLSLLLTDEICRWDTVLFISFSCPLSDHDPEITSPLTSWSIF